ncbi:hypothetical protein POM88_027494 [Heracleum sosnowskyi]|uniref:Uncharacterized protein n=1 Tax=Heracleum sosnowskyi TaxID=360622 RepID=A0AAD8I8J1_9APIA|nr:hypothetical protein POM88_027494 [Heracleum sosnowskyi]
MQSPFIPAVIDDNKTMESVREAMVHHKVCYVFSKPLSHLDIASFWQHIPRAAIKSMSKKSRMRWTSELQEMFGYAIETLGEDAGPRMILETMKEPDLKYGHVASHLQKYRNGPKNSVNLLKSSWSSSCMESHRAPQIQRSPDWPQTPNSIMDNRGVHVPKGGVAQGIGQNLSSGLQTPNHELAGATDHVIPSSDLLRNDLSAANHELAGAASEAVNPVSNNHNIGEGSSADQLFDVDSFMDIDGFMEKLDKQP